MSSSPTQLSAIMFTDIAGYSRLMEEDEERTIRLLKAHNDIVLPLIEAAGGEVIDAIGDGLFVLFPSVREAVNCGGRIQEAITNRNRDEDEREQFSLRIGVHLGEIWRDGDRVYGNGVNVAARVQPFASPGGICVSEDVYRQIANKTDYTLQSIGMQSLHNIERRMELYRVVLGTEIETPTIAAGAPAAVGELDVVKEKILEAREKVAAKKGEADAGAGRESEIESKVYSFVEKVMDKAINKWEEMPEEKKQNAIAKIEGAIAEGVSEADGDVEISIGGGKNVSVSSRKKLRRMEKERQEVTSQIGTGAACSIGFGLGYFYFSIGWMIWPFAIIGVLPLLIGVRKAIKLRGKLKRLQAQRPAQLERTVLKLAGDLGGVVTVVQIASAGGLTLEDAQSTLDAMTAKGYVAQNITESGVIEYEFPSLKK